MDYETILFETEGEVGVLTLNRPEVVNAVNRKMMEELNEFWLDRQQDFDTRVIVLAGAGEKGFSSGLDMKDATSPEGFAKGGLTPENSYNNQSRFSNILRLMRACPQPIVAAVHGYAMGAGLSFALAADVRLSSPDAIFCAQYINIGLGGADLGSSYFLWRIVGWGRAAEMCLSGCRVSADDAYRVGLVNHLYERGELLDQAKALAQDMASKSKMGLRLTKDALNASLNICSLEDANKMEDRNQAFLIVSGLAAGSLEGD